jgi:hypothetical protein
MIKASGLSSEARKVWESLDEEQKKAIQKDNPFQVERDQAIYGLSQRGLCLDILAEITGLSRSAIHRTIIRLTYPGNDRRYGRKRGPAKSRINLEVLYRELLSALNKAFGKGGDETNVK